MSAVHIDILPHTADIVGTFVHIQLSSESNPPQKEATQDHASIITIKILFVTYSNNISTLITRNSVRRTPWI